MIVHDLINIQVRAGRGIETGKQLINNDQQLHIVRLIDELFFYRCLKFLNLFGDTGVVCCVSRINANHPQIDAILFKGVGFLGIADGFGAQVTAARLIRGNDRTLIKVLLLE